VPLIEESEQHNTPTESENIMKAPEEVIVAHAYVPTPEGVIVVPQSALDRAFNEADKDLEEEVGIVIVPVGGARRPFHCGVGF